MKKLSLLALTTALIAIPVSAHAEWYAGAGGGFQVPRDQEIKAGGVKQDVEYDNGWGALGAVGYKYGTGLRSELELGYRGAGVDSVSASATDAGSARIYSLMANTIYDIPTSLDFSPYIGAGVGAAKVSYDNVRTISGSVVDDSDIVPALQALVGFNVPFAENLDFFAQYQYQYLFDVEPNTNSGVRVDADYGNSLILAGVRYTFSEPLKPVAVAEPVAAALVELPKALPEVVEAPAIEKYMVFFDFDRSDITIEAADILKKVADNAEKGKVTRIELTGHADRAGKDKYNEKLSARRAEAVKKQLMRLGLPESEIATSAKGEREPLVQTGDGVREPQNRRVEIVYGN